MRAIVAKNWKTKHKDLTSWEDAGLLEQQPLIIYDYFIVENYIITASVEAIVLLKWLIRHHRDNNNLTIGHMYQ